METEKERRIIKEINRLKELLHQKEQDIEKLKMSNLFFETLFEGINEEIIVLDSHFVIQDANKVFLNHYGMEKKDVVGQKCYEVTFGSDRPCVAGGQLCPLEEAKRTKKKVKISHYHDHKGKDRRELIRIMYPVLGHQESPEYFVEISRDLPDNRNLIKKLKVSQKRFRAILDTATDAILSIDANHKIILFNNAAQRIFGYSRSEVLGKNPNMIVPLQYGDHSRFVKKFLETKKPTVIGKTMSLTAVKKGGKEFPIELGLSYHEMEEGITFTAIIRDVTSQKQLEKKLLQSERLAAVGQTVAHVAHEIKNPLMIIGGFSHQIKKSLTDKKAVQKLDMIFEEVTRLEKLAANLGDFVKEYRLMKRPADINSVILDVIKIIGDIYPPEKYSFVADLDSDLGEISCDPDKMKQVFMNIIANGIQAMSDGGKITIRTAQKHYGTEIRISDEGIGINENELDHIFEPFYTTRKMGSGLGLSISYKIVAAHKGEISAISTPGKGTTFIIRLPAD